MVKIKPISDLNRYKQYQEGICEFMSLVKDEISDSKPNYTTKDYLLYHYQAWLGRKISSLSPRKVANEKNKSKKSKYN